MSEVSDNRQEADSRPALSGAFPTVALSCGSISWSPLRRHRILSATYPPTVSEALAQPQLAGHLGTTNSKRAGPQRSSRTSGRSADTGQIWIGGLGVLPAAPPPTVNLGAGGDCGYDEAHDINAMTDHHPIDVEQLLADQLATASPDLLRGLLSTFIQALIERGG
jgi:hypothetical protein